MLPFGFLSEVLWWLEVYSEPAERPVHEGPKFIGFPLLKSAMTQNTRARTYTRTCICACSYHHVPGCR